MCSAYQRGVSLLEGLEPIAFPDQRSNIELSWTSAQMEGINKLPKNVALLKPVMGQLIDKVALAARSDSPLIAQCRTFQLPMI
jgi:hypothetical protein